MSGFSSSRVTLFGAKSRRLSGMLAMIMHFVMDTCFSDRFVSSTQNSWLLFTSVIALSVSKNVQLAQKFFGFKIRRRKQVLVNIIGMWKHGANITFVTSKL